MFSTLTDLFVTSPPRNFCCIVRPDGQSTQSTTQSRVANAPNTKSKNGRSHKKSRVRGPFAIEKVNIDDVSERPIFRPARKMERAVILEVNEDDESSTKPTAGSNPNGPAVQITGLRQGHRRDESMKSGLSFSATVRKSKHSRQMSCDSITSVLGEEMVHWYVRAIWLLEGDGQNEKLL
ncbi:Protein of unknown function [Pyronema omphalodes CBS 100304]|uniref:Uncharacterized protein n=1 Tax=Pyronema omphalodes (strain CBS 100304) TaxID=1076935 RepID=U4L078_PYROM|nr:Protein of unknown function [Pyronema omphalodes CBS 100304]